MAARSTIAAGDFQTAANWDGGTLPDFVNDTLTIGHAMDNISSVICGTGAGAGTTVGMQITSTGSFHHHGGTWSIGYAVAFAGGALDQLKISTPGAVQFIGGAGNCYLVGPNGTFGTTCGIQIRGTAGNLVNFTCAASSNGRFGSFTATEGQGTFSFDAEYASFIKLGKTGVGGNYWMRHLAVQAATQKFRLNNCRIDQSGQMAIACIATSDIILEYTLITNPINAVSQTDIFITGTRSTTGVRRILNFAAPQSTICWSATSMFNWNIQNYTCARVFKSGLTDNAVETVHKNFFYYITTNSSNVLVQPGLTVTQGAAFVDSAVTPFAGQNQSGFTGTATLDCVLVQCSSPDSSQDGNSYGAINSNFTWYEKRYINFKGAGDLSSGGLHAEHGNKFTFYKISHCSQSLTRNGTGILNVMVGAVYYGHANYVTNVEDSIFYANGVIGGSGGFAISDYPNSPDTPGDEPDHAMNNIVSTVGSTSTVLQFAGFGFDTTANETLASAGVVMRVTATVASGPAIGEECVVASNTANTVTVTGGFTGSVFDGVTFFGKVVDKFTPAGIRSNYYFGAASGRCYDTTGTITAPQLGLTGVMLSTFVTNINSVDGGAGTDPVANGPKFLLKESDPITGDWDLITAHRQFMGYTAPADWVTGHNYVIGDIVKHSSADFFVSRDFDFYCIQNHTSGAASEPGKNPGFSTYRTQWIPAFVYYLSLELSRDTRYSNPNILFLGDTLNTPANNLNALEMMLSRGRHAYRPTNPVVLAMSAVTQDGICPGAVDGNIPLPIPPVTSSVFRRGFVGVQVAA